MKKLLILLLAFVFLSATKGLSQNAVKGGLYYTRFNIDGQTGVGCYAEYSKYVSNLLFIAPSFQMAYGTKGVDFPYYLINKFSTGIDINFFLIPVRSSWGSLKIGVGPSGRFFSGRNLSAFTVTTNGSGFGNLGPDGKYYVPYFFPNDRINPNYAAIGYSAIIEAELKLTSYWMTGVRVSHQGYSSKDKITTFGANLSYHF